MRKKHGKDMSGSGAVRLGTDMENRIIEIDFGSNKSLLEYKNTESILFFVADSYYETFCRIRDEINRCFVLKKGDVLHYVLPYYFNFRHYVEITLKAISVITTRKQIYETHELNNLLNDIKEGLNNISISSKWVYETEAVEFSRKKDESIKLINQLEKLVNEYLEMEPTSEYYRYIFGRNAELNKPVVRLDFKKTEELFYLIAECIKNVEISLHSFLLFYHFNFK